MYEKFQLSLYDFFGFFFPGLLLTGSCLLVFKFDRLQEAVRTGFNATEWALLVLVSYMIGHVLQGLSNIIFDWKHRKEYFRVAKGGIPESIHVKVREKITAELHMDADELDDKWVYRVCEKASGQDGLGEVFVYREGFYRGMSVASGAVAAAILFSSITALAARPAQGASFLPDMAVILLDLLAFAAAAVLFYRRYDRFRNYRIRHALLGFLVKKEEGNAAEEGGPGS